jgi:dynein heavy chain
LDTIQLVLPKIKEQLDAVKILVAIVETNMPSLLKKEEKELTQEVYILDVNLFININEAESQTTKNMERFKRSLKERLEKMIKEIDELQTQCDNDKFKHASTDV